MEASRSGLPLRRTPWLGHWWGCHTAKPVWLGPACPWAPSCHPPCPVHGRGPHLAATGRSSSSPKSSPRSRGDRRLRWLPWQRRQKWWASWRRSSACGCGRAGGASKALARWPHSSRPGVSVAEGTQEKNGQFGRLGHPLASHRSLAPTNTQGMSCGSSLLPAETQKNLTSTSATTISLQPIPSHTGCETHGYPRVCRDDFFRVLATSFWCLPAPFTHSHHPRSSCQVPLAHSPSQHTQGGSSEG